MEQMNNNNHQTQYIEEQVTFAELARRLNITNLDEPEVYDLERDHGYEYQIKSMNPLTGEETWENLEQFVVKKNSPHHYQLGNLKGTPAHKVWFNGEWVTLENHPQAIKVEEPIQVVDCQVANTHTYLADGQINHNTTTPGGKALPYASSVRIKIGAGKPLVKTIDGKERIIGVGVTAKVIKNRMSAPFREVDFEIHFGKGVKESEQVFDYLREWCDKHQTKDNACILDGKRISVEGTGAWKVFTIADSTTGEVLKEIKFYKSEFGDKILYNSQFSKEMIALMDAAYLLKNETPEEHPTFVGQNPNDADEALTAEETDGNV